MKINIPSSPFITSNHKDEVKAKILNWYYKTNSRAGDTLDNRNLMHAIYIKLHPKQQDHCQEAIDELTSAGLVKDTNKDSIALTEKAAEVIY